MLTIKDFMEVVEYRITETSEYQWKCYGPNALTMDSWNGGYDEDGYSVSVVFDTKHQTVYEMTAYDYVKSRAYRWIHPGYVKAHTDECIARNTDDEAWDDVPYITLDVEEDILEKSRALVAGEEYDTRVMIEVDFSDTELLTYMKLAHEQDITFNEFVSQALSSMLERLESKSYT